MDYQEVLLPKIIFLSGSDAAAKRRFAAELADLRFDCVALGFAEPLRGAVLGTFFQCDPLIDLQDPTLKLPGVSHSSENFQKNYHAHLNIVYGEGVLGRIMAHRIKEYLDNYDTFIFEDAEDPYFSDVIEIANIFAPSNCLYVMLNSGTERQTYSIPLGVRKIQLLKNSVPMTLLRLLSEPQTAT